MSEAAAIEVEDLTVIYNEGTPNEVLALDGVSFCLAQEENVVITGGNGSGKSTLLKAIAGSVPIKSGKVVFDGVDVTKWSAARRARRLAFVHQDPMLGTCPNLTVFENLMLSSGGRWWDLSLPTLKLSAEHQRLISKTGLPLMQKLATPVNMLSGGQRQVISLCMALSTSCAVLLLDEFTASLDEKTKAMVLGFVFGEAKENKRAVMTITHDGAWARSAGARQLVFAEGHLEPQ